MSQLPAAVLVDQDGTVVDTEPVWERCEGELLSSMGGVLTRQMRTQMVGGPLRTTVEVMLSAAPHPRPVDEVEAELVDAVANYIHEHGAPWMKETPAFISRVRSMGVPIGLVTSAWGRIARAVAAQAPSGGFDLVIAGDEVAQPKPAPDAYLEAARQLSVDIRNCVVVEDSPTGIRAGVASGAHVVVIPGEIAIPASPDYSRLSSLEELTEEALIRLTAGEIIDTCAN
ncbi:HAD family hydrolase [Schaalia vaccimaxillae]|uniref:HAD family hydrolase n=1 Tax=Schaalia vaccimaxillae TaxID=183916 RepID=UPI0003B3F2F0|nr:HAD family phosphatase [Schaalia vaccimaxillae]